MLLYKPTNEKGRQTLQWQGGLSDSRIQANLQSLPNSHFPLKDIGVVPPFMLQWVSNKSGYRSHEAGSLAGRFRSFLGNISETNSIPYLLRG